MDVQWHIKIKEKKKHTQNSKRTHSEYVCLCRLRWNLPGPDNYALQYADGVQTYITESVSPRSTSPFVHNRRD